MYAGRSDNLILFFWCYHERWDLVSVRREDHCDQHSPSTVGNTGLQTTGPYLDTKKWLKLISFPLYFLFFACVNCIFYFRIQFTGLTLSPTFSLTFFFCSEIISAPPTSSVPKNLAALAKVMVKGPSLPALSAWTLHCRLFQTLRIQTLLLLNMACMAWYYKSYKSYILRHFPYVWNREQWQIWWE